MPIGTISALVLGPILAYIIWTITCLELNVRKARALRVPYIRLPVDSNNVLWAIVQPSIWALLDRLAFPWSSYPDFVRYSRRGWHFHDRSKTHVRLGPVWALVTPATLYLHFADPGAINEIFTRRSDFVRPVKEYKLLEVYGPCISTAGWDDWARHRRVLAAPFNESIMEFVWDESLRQARSMLRSWVSAAEKGIPSMQRDVRTLSLNVLASTAFRKSYEFQGSADPTKTNDDSETGVNSSNSSSSSYRDSLQTVLDNIILLMLVPHRLLASRFVSKRWARIGRATASFKRHMATMLEHETAALAEGTPGSGGIMTAFVRALETHTREVDASDASESDVKSSSLSKRGLSVDEIYGNLFVLNFAGHDTTANTLAFSMLLLAANPEVQDWVCEEIQTVVTKGTPPEEWHYKDLFPELKRCRAVLLETLRLYPPIMALPKRTSRKAKAQSQQTYTIKVGNDRVLTIPPGVGTVPYLRAIQCHPDYWPDPHTWKPSRWILKRPSSTSTSAHSSSPSPSPGNFNQEGLNEEQLLTPKPNTYFPWSAGPQNCPGKKFSEVEAVAVLACIFGRHRVAVKKLAGESDEAARKRALACVDDVDMEMLLRMANADQVTLVCREVQVQQG